MTVSRLREGVLAARALVSRLGGRSQLGEDHTNRKL